MTPSFFLDFVVGYSDSTIFATVILSFLDSTCHFLDFVARYSDSAILLQ
jgi:hypothetical protein